MKKSSLISIVLILVLVVAGIIWYGQTNPGTQGSNGDENGYVDVSDTTKISSTLSEYKNAELGFSVKYPNTWQSEDSNAGVTFIAPIDKEEVSTIGTLQASIQVVPGVCAFPPVTTVKERSTMKSGDFTFNTISMSNTVQGRVYTNRMYSLQKGEICYMFSFASIALSPSSKGLTGSNLTQAENNNKAITATAESQFTDMVKSFAFLSGPSAVDETTVAPVK